MDRKISVRATRDELIERGILLPDVASVGHTNTTSGNMPPHVSRLPQYPNNFSFSEKPIHGKHHIIRRNKMIFDNKGGDIPIFREYGSH